MNQLSCAHLQHASSSARRGSCCTVILAVRLPALSEHSPNCQDEKRRSGGGPCPQEQCLAGAYFGWACPNKHTETLQPQLRASPWLTSRPVTPPQKTSQGERDNEPDPEPKPAEVRRAKRCLLSEPGLSHACRPRVCSRRRACLPESVQLTHLQSSSHRGGLVFSFAG